MIRGWISLILLAAFAQAQQLHVYIGGYRPEWHLNVTKYDLNGEFVDHAQYSTTEPSWDAIVKLEPQWIGTWAIWDLEDYYTLSIQESALKHYIRISSQFQIGAYICDFNTTQCRVFSA
jgi:hypothetical protein